MKQYPKTGTAESCRARRTRTLLGVMLWAVLGAGTASGQTQDAELAACAAIEREAARLACYDRVIRSSTARDADVDERDRAAAAATEQEPRPGAERAAGRAPEPAATSASPDAAGTRAREPVVAAAPAPAAEPEPQTGEAVPIEEFPQTRAERRAARRAARGEQEQAFSVVVVRHRENLSGLSVFVADTGEIYDQVSVSQVRLPDVPFTANLERATRGSFWLTTEAANRPIRVTRRN